MKTKNETYYQDWTIRELTNVPASMHYMAKRKGVTLYGADLHELEVSISTLL